MSDDIKKIKGITNLLNDGEDIGIEYMDINGNQKYNIFEVDTLLSYICRIQKENEHIRSNLTKIIDKYESYEGDNDTVLAMNLYDMIIATADYDDNNFDIAYNISLDEE